jgi:hypothetical protein
MMELVTNLARCVTDEFLGVIITFYKYCILVSYVRRTYCENKIHTVYFKIQLNTLFSAVYHSLNTNTHAP